MIASFRSSRSWFRREYATFCQNLLDYPFGPIFSLNASSFSLARFEGMILDREVKLAQGIRAVKDMDEKLDKDFHALEARYERWNKRKAMSRYGSEREQQAAAHVATSIPGVPSGAGAGGAGAAAAGGSATLTGAAEAVPRTV